ncbi:hypothetical protein C8R44DRAFT_606163, partial [Mycena epipterygia]
VVTRTDQLSSPYDQLDLKTNEDGIIRNAGGSAEAAISNIVFAQHFIGVTEIAAIHYTDCGRERFTTEGLRETAKKANPGRDDVCSDGRWYGFPLHHQHIRGHRHSILVKGSKITGWMYDDETGKASLEPLNYQPSLTCLFFQISQIGLRRRARRGNNSYARKV